ncbi:MAG: tryptophan synthase subunit beta [Aquamicrobium sp.]|uniref:tryptophan synthase subunit beta n=1 Tax=Mesorhizobium sp. Pch-S TaxID=2082387 RepID=UPI001010A46F|nr:tryptophan synthase subunit beta [Mesorhizobium sp. Pch-S]MBR2687143.1 tryptophan synthase subunit beta [Aquamicrobium sp.]QAZ44891.1 tryptophan synthase subunit beta [Mesorhizobium sp. Pch-S]
MSRQVSETYLKTHPDSEGHYGRYGGIHYPEALRPELVALAETYRRALGSEDFQRKLEDARAHFQGRPTPVHRLANLSAQIGGATLFVKREDLNHTGAHKLNHCVGFALLARHMGKTKLIAETGAGQHGVALATAAACFGLECEVHIGEVDFEKAHSNVSRMKVLGATVVVATRGQSALKEASDSAYDAYVRQHRQALYAIGSAIGPHPFPMIVRDFQSVVGQEARQQFLAMNNGALPNHVVACVAGGSNAMGIYAGFLDDKGVSLHGVEPLGKSAEPGEHAATLSFGTPGTLHGARCIVLQDAEGNVAKVSSIASGLVYPGVGPEICMLHDAGRVSFTAVDDMQAVSAFYRLSRAEGIIPALESAHAVAFAMQLAERCRPSERILINLSGRGDKDVDFVTTNYGG